MASQEYYFDFCEPRDTSSWLDALRPELDPLLRQSDDPDTRILDLLDIAMAAYAADRISRRRLGARRDPEDLVQGRTIRLRVPIRNPESWSRTYKDQLEALLAELTFDVWEIEFVLRRSAEPVQPALVGEPLVQPFVTLFSGGLDSVAGTLIELSQRDEGTALLVHGSTSTRQRSMQSVLLHGIQKRLKPTRPVRFSYALDGLTSERFPEHSQEKSQRVRGLVYLTLGAVTAALTSASEILVFENGVGAINLPYTRANAGADHSRSVHPTVLLRMQELLSCGLGIEVRIRNPFMWSTKGKMVAKVARMGHKDLALMSVSCDGFPLRKRSRQCGTCTSCLLRRASLLVGGLHNEDRKVTGEYLFDVFETTHCDPGGRLHPLGSMFAQVERMRNSMKGAMPRRSLFTEFTELYETLQSLSKLEGIEEEVIAERLEALFRDYVREMELFSQLVPHWGLQEKAIA